MQRLYEVPDQANYTSYSYILTTYIVCILLGSIHALNI